MVTFKKMSVSGDIGAIKFAGTLDLEGFFKMLREWFSDNHFEWYEKKLKHKMQKDGMFKREMEWAGVRKVNEYVKNTVDMFFIIRKIQKVEVIKGGKKEILTKCEMLLEIDGEVEFDYTNRFGGSKFLQFLQDFYHRYIIKRDIFWIWADSYYYDLIGLQKKIKTYLEFEGKTGR